MSSRSDFERKTEGRSRPVLAALVLGLAAFVHAPGAQAAPIVVTYALSGGSTGGPSGVGNVIGGSITFSFVNPMSLPRSAFTGGTASALTFVLTGTGGVANIGTPNVLAALGTGIFALAPTGSISGTHSGTYGGVGAAGQSIGGIPGGGVISGALGLLPGTLILSWSAVTGQEVVAPEPATSSLLGFGLLLAAAVGTGVRRSRRRTATS